MIAPGRRLLASLLLALVLAAALAQAWIVTHYGSLPGSLFGADVWYQLGCIHSIRASLNPMASCSACGGLPGYLPLYGTLIAVVSMVTGLDAETAVLAMAVVLKVASLLLVFAVFARLHGGWTGLCVAALWSALQTQPVLRYTEFTQELLVPLFYLALHRLVATPTARRALALGLVLALLGYAHAVAFVPGVLIFLLCVALDAVMPGVERPPWRVRLGLVTLVLACLPLALGYWWKPIFVSHGRLSTHYLDWNRESTLLSLGEQIHFAKRVAHWAFDTSAAKTLLNLLVIAGGVLALRRLREPETRAGLILAVATFLSVFHYFLTQPLLGMNFVPEYMVMMLWSFARLFLIALPIAALPGMAVGSRVVRWAAAVTVALAIAIAVRQAGAALEDPESRTPLPPLYREMASWVRAHTSHDDVFLSTNELSFALAALTGRKVLVTRRGQNDPYLDMDARNLDAALILYGDDPVLRRERLDAWGIDYVLWTRDWAWTNHHVSERTGEFEPFDPLLWFQDPFRDSAATRAGIRIEHQVTWVDPNIRYARVRKFPLTIVTPVNDTRPDRPWRPELDPALEPVWTRVERGRPVAAIYRVRR